MTSTTLTPVNGSSCNRLRMCYVNLRQHVVPQEVEADLVVVDLLPAPLPVKGEVAEDSEIDPRLNYPLCWPVSCTYTLTTFFWYVVTLVVT